MIYSQTNKYSFVIYKKTLFFSLFIYFVIKVPVAPDIQGQQEQSFSISDSEDAGAGDLSLADTALASPDLERNFSAKRNTIRWSDFRKKVVAVLPDYSLEQLTQELAELGVEAQYIGGDIHLNASAGYKLNVDPNYRDPSTGTSGSSSTHSIQIKPSVSKKFLMTGTTVSAGLENTLRMQSIDGGDVTNTSIIAPYINVKQDLLQNFLGLLSRLDIADAKRKLQIAKETRKNNERNLQQRYDQMYLAWILQWRTRKLLLEQLGKSRTSLQNARQQRDINYIDNGTYQQIYSAHLNYRKALLDNEQQLLASDQSFARFLGKGKFQPDLGLLEELLAQAKNDFAALQFSDSWLWLQTQKNLERADILYKYKKLSRLPSLTLSSSLELKTTATYGSSEQPDYSDIAPTYALELALSWPMLRRKANNEIKNVKNQLEQLEQSLRKQQQEFAINIAKQRAGQQLQLENYKLQQDILKAKSAVYASNQVKYRQARASIRDLLDAELQKLSAELSLLATEDVLIRQLLDYSYETRDGDLLRRK